MFFEVANLDSKSGAHSRLDWSPPQLDFAPIRNATFCFSCVGQRANTCCARQKEEGGQRGIDSAHIALPRHSSDSRQSAPYF